MMYRVEIEKKCGCFTRSKIGDLLQFDTKEEARQKTEEILKVMNEKFCGKHRFRAIDEGTIIRVVEDEGNG